ncbi:hypothetical protein MBOU_43380 [Mycobacterium bourgelatii]|uniref:Uncharacterized protein n=1 Tax=Mycobacterium bourgelatii TaxID=1273442 RepID=A0A7I9YUN7_MYCBU|nr:hypothetical protein MBOU_43380 [Mycobacterium bourgelatii]
MADQPRRPPSTTSLTNPAITAPTTIAVQQPTSPTRQTRTPINPITNQRPPPPRHTLRIPNLLKVRAGSAATTHDAITTRISDAHGQTKSATLLNQQTDSSYPTRLNTWRTV